MTGTGRHAAVRGLILAVATAVVYAALPLSAQKPAPPQPPTAPAPAVPVKIRTWTGDLDGMIKRRTIRVLVPYNRTNYFIDKGVQRGITYEAFRDFEDVLNKKLKTGNLRVNVVLIPTSRDALASALLEGRGDIVAANITVTDARRKLADFTLPTLTGVKEVVVQAPGSTAKLASLDDLAGQTVYVRERSIYFDNVTALSNALVKKGRPAIVIKTVPTSLEDEDLLEMTNAGLLTMTVVDDHMAGLWKNILPGLIVRNDLAVATGQEVAWAIRQNSPQLKAELDAFVKANARGTAKYNMLFARYFKNAAFAKSATSDAEIKKFDNLLAIFRKYGEQYGMDWVLMAAQGYQESGLNQTVKSPVGAIGVMQVMPATGKEMAVGDIRQIEANINAGVKYIRYVIDRYYKDEPMDALDKGLFAFASYNAGPARVRQLRKEAQAEGLDPNVWFNNVEHIAAKRIGRETVTYVSNIYKYYVAYTLALEQSAARRKAVGIK
jgi:membrane-bound lytic murein transglycosylase MltF